MLPISMEFIIGGTFGIFIGNFLCGLLLYKSIKMGFTQGILAGIIYVILMLSVKGYQEIKVRDKMIVELAAQVEQLQEASNESSK